MSVLQSTRNLAVSIIEIPVLCALENVALHIWISMTTLNLSFDIHGQRLQK